MFYILFAVYIAAVNYFAFLYIRKQKKENEYQLEKSKFKDGKLWICSALGGAPTAFFTLIFSKFRTDDLLLMILLPIIAVLNIYLCILFLKSGIFSRFSFF